MKEKRNLLIGMILGVLISWALVFVSVPFIIKNFSFLLGFIACLVLISLGLMLLLFWNKKPFLAAFSNNKSTSKDSGDVIRIYALIRILIFIFIVVGILVSSFLIFKQNEMFKSQTQYQEKRMEHQSALIESVRNGNLVYLMSNILDKVDEELKNNPKRTLSDETIARIAALSHSLKPYAYWEGGQLSEKKLSPERGQLLLALSKMNIDSTSFDKIKFRTTFSRADLKGANLRKADLNGIDLSGADMREANLKEANLEEANLWEVNLWGANLEKTNIRKANMRNTNLSWAELNETDLSEAALDGADLSSAKLRRADLSGANLQRANLDGAFLNQANLTRVELLGTFLRRANLRQANLREANLTLASLDGANLFEVNLIDAVLIKTRFEEENWLEKLEEWRVIGAKEIQARYKVVVDITGKSNYRLIKIED